MEKLFYSSLVVFSALYVAKAFLVVPPTSPTRHQLISGIGIPLAVKDESITMGLVMKAQYYLPETVDQLKFTFFPDVWAPFDRMNNSDEVWHVFPNGRRRRGILTDPTTGQKYERYDVKVDQVGDAPLYTMPEKVDNDFTSENDDDDFDDQFEEDLHDKKALNELFLQQNQQRPEAEKESDLNLMSSRWVAYDTLSSMLDSKGFNGRICVLRGICEAAEVQFSDHLMAELFHILFTPSTTSEPVSKASDYDYIKAESIGSDKTHPDCGTVFHQCSRSIMEIFTEVYDNKMFQFY